MKATIDISLYPLHAQYKDEIIYFVQQLKKQKTLKVAVNGMSTQIFGDYDDLMSIMQQEMKQLLTKTRAVFVLKITSDEMTMESLPEVLK